MIGNIFYSYKEIDASGELFKSWIELTNPVWEALGSDTSDVVSLKRWLAFLEGGLLPIISLTSLHFFIKYEDKKEDGEDVNQQIEPKIIEKIVEVPVEKIVEKIVEVPVDRIVEVEKIVEVPVDRNVEVEKLDDKKQIDQYWEEVAEELYEKEKIENTTTTTTIQEKKVLNYTKPN